MTTADYIAKFGLEPHPEGGWYRRTWRAPDGRSQRGALSMIYFLLEAHQTCAWHRTDADEMWLWHAGADLVLSSLADGVVTEQVVGPQNPQGFVKGNLWQGARPVDGWVLVTCLACPGFDPEGWALAPEGWTPADGAP